MGINCNFVQNEFQVTGFCRSPQETRKSSPTGSMTSSVSNAMLTPSRQLTDAEKLRKVILELVDTERAYVKVILIQIGFFPIFSCHTYHIHHTGHVYTYIAYRYRCFQSIWDVRQLIQMAFNFIPRFNSVYKHDKIQWVYVRISEDVRKNSASFTNVNM